MQGTKDGQGLFVQCNGSPMVFHLPPGSTKKKLAPIITEHGGEITSRHLNNAIHLVDEKLYTSLLLNTKSDYYWPTFIVDCVEQNALLDMEMYKCSKGKQLMRRIPSEGGNNSTFHELEFDFGEALPPVRKKKGRMQYTKAEDMNILKFLIKNGEYNRAKGAAVWKTMEKLQITSHSAQSMMTRFRKVILTQIDDYNIPDSWKTRLTGDLTRFVPTSTTSTTPATSYTSTTIVHNRGDRLGRGSGSENEGDPFTVGTWLRSRTSKAGHLSKTSREEETDQQFSANAPTSDGEEKVEENGDSCDQLLCSKSGHQTEEPQNSNGQDCRDDVDNVQHEAEAHDSLDKELLQMAHGGPCDKLGSDHTRLHRSAHALGASAAEPVVNSTVVERFPVEKRRIGRAGESQSQQEGDKEEEIAALLSLNVHRQRVHRLLPQNAGWRSRSSSRSHQKAAEAADEDVPQEEEVKLAGGSASPTLAKAATPPHPSHPSSSDHRGSPSTPSTQLCPVTPPVSGRSLCSVTSMIERGECVPDSGQSSSDDDNYPELSRKPFTSEAVMNGKHGGKPAKRMTSLGAIRALSQEFDLTLKQAKVLLRRNSGHVDATRYWIMMGRTLPGHYYWTQEEDDVLLNCEPDHPHWQQLEQKYGHSPVLRRIQWLQS